jgi:hypothetical protein
MRSRDPFVSQSRSAVNGSPLSEKIGKSGRTESEIVGSSVSQDRDPAQDPQTGTLWGRLYGMTEEALSKSASTG